MGFINISIADIVDIVLVAIIMYYLYTLIRGTHATSILTGILLVYVVWVVVKALNMELMSAILGNIISVGMIALIVIFQPELRRFLQNIGDRSQTSGGTFLNKIFNPKHSQQGPTCLSENINPIVKACSYMADHNVGALIVIKREGGLQEVVETGVMIDAIVSDSLLRNIFFKNSPLHDGAVVIDGKRIVAAKCVLPTTHSEVPIAFGMRHRAAIGISEESDAIVVVVSEEQGNISIVHEGKIKVGLSSTELKAELMKIQNSKEEENQ